MAVTVACGLAEVGWWIRWDQRTVLDGDRGCRRRGIDLRGSGKENSFPAATQAIVEVVIFAHGKRCLGQVAGTKN